MASGDGQIPQNQNPGNISGPQLEDVTQQRVTGASVVTSISGIRLWQNEVTDDEWWVRPPGANAKDGGRGLG